MIVLSSHRSLQSTSHWRGPMLTLDPRSSLSCFECITNKFNMPILSVKLKILPTFGLGGVDGISFGPMVGKLHESHQAGRRKTEPVTNSLMLDHSERSYAAQSMIKDSVIREWSAAAAERGIGRTSVHAVKVAIQCDNVSFPNVRFSPTDRGALRSTSNGCSCISCTTYSLHSILSRFSPITSLQPQGIFSSN